MVAGPNSGSVTISSAGATSQVLSVPFTITASSSSTAWPNGYSYAGTITVSHTQVPNTDHDEFPSACFGDLSGVSSQMAAWRPGDKCEWV